MQILRVVSLIIVIALLSFATSAQKSDPKLTTTVVASNKYGEGGTLETTSTEKAKLVKEVWKDKAGNIREVHSFEETGKTEVAPTEKWKFYKVGDPIDRPSLSISIDENHKIFSSANYFNPNVDKAQAEEWVKKIETQFAKDGTITKPWDEPATKPEQPETNTTVDQPKLPSTEVFNKPKESKAEEPKKEEPKSDKSSAGNGGKTASIAPTFTAPGYKIDVKRDFGLTSPTFTTPYGDFKINIPGDVQPGDPFSGTVWLNPLGKNAEERTNNARELHDYSVKLSTGIELKFPWKLGRELWVEELYPTGELRHAAGNEFLEIRHRGEPVGRVQLPISPGNTPQPTHFTIPTGAQYGSIITIPGPFDGILSQTDFVEIGGERIPILSESPRSRVVWDRSTLIGPSQIKVGENGQTYQCPFHNVAVKMSAPNLNLKRGETTVMTVVVSGLASVKQDVPFELVNHSTAIVSMEGGNQQSNTIHAETAAHATDLKADGTYTTTRTLTGITPGRFTITGTVRWRDTCKPSMEVMQVPKKPAGVGALAF